MQLVIIHVGETLRIGDDVKITVRDIQEGQVDLDVTAPLGKIRMTPGELYQYMKSHTSPRMPNSPLPALQISSPEFAANN